MELDKDLKNVDRDYESLQNIVIKEMEKNAFDKRLTDKIHKHFDDIFGYI